jgi:hypothetical protein
MDVPGVSIIFLILSRLLGFKAASGLELEELRFIYQGSIREKYPWEMVTGHRLRLLLLLPSHQGWLKGRFGEEGG